jgi:hypothetical protein
LYSQLDVKITKSSKLVFSNYKYQTNCCKSFLWVHFQHLQLIGGRNTGPGLGDLSLERGLTGLKLRHLLALVSLLDVVLGNAVVGQAGEGDLLLQELGVGGLATSSALGHGPLGDANLAGVLDHGVLQDGALAALGSQRLGNLNKQKSVLE